MCQVLGANGGLEELFSPEVEVSGCVPPGSASADDANLSTSSADCVNLSSSSADCANLSSSSADCVNLSTFSADDVGVDNGNYFGLPVCANAGLHLLPVEWDATVSYGSGTSLGPESIRAASLQVEIYDPHFPGAWERGIATLSPLAFSRATNDLYRGKARQVIHHLASGGTTADVADLLSVVNAGSEQLNSAVYSASMSTLRMGSKVGLVGGDHSTPLGQLRALSDFFGESGRTFGILHLDAHADLRDSYEGFTYSHASIMRNVLRDCLAVERLVQVGLRDYSDGERTFALEQGGRVVWFENRLLREREFGGMSWRSQCEAILNSLPHLVYISCDIDGLSPIYCPGTGTPVPGGLSFDEWTYLLKMLRDSGREVIGFDLTEVSPSHPLGVGSFNPSSAASVGACSFDSGCQSGEPHFSSCDSGVVEADCSDAWDSNVGARVLYKLCGSALY